MRASVDEFHGGVDDLQVEATVRTELHLMSALVGIRGRPQGFLPDAFGGCCSLWHPGFADLRMPLAFVLPDIMHTGKELAAGTLVNPADFTDMGPTAIVAVDQMLAISGQGSHRPW